MGIGKCFSMALASIISSKMPDERSDRSSDGHLPGDGYDQY